MTASKKIKNAIELDQHHSIDEFLKEIESILVPTVPYHLIPKSEETWMNFQNLIENNYSWLMSQHLPILQIILGVIQHYEYKYMSYDLFSQMNRDIQTKCKYFLEV